MVRDQNLKKNHRDIKRTHFWLIFEFFHENNLALVLVYLKVCVVSFSIQKFFYFSF